MKKKPLLIPVRPTKKQRAELVAGLSTVAKRAAESLCTAMVIVPDVGLIIQACIDAAASVTVEDLIACGKIPVGDASKRRNELHQVMLAAWGEKVRSLGGTVSFITEGDQRAAEEN